MMQDKDFVLLSIVTLVSALIEKVIKKIQGSIFKFVFAMWFKIRIT